MLTIQEEVNEKLEDVAQRLLDQEIWVSWPHMVEAKVVAVRDVRRTLTTSSSGGIVSSDPNESRNREEFNVLARGIAERFGSFFPSKEPLLVSSFRLRILILI